jgi:hypothetical protein
MKAANLRCARCDSPPASPEKLQRLIDKAPVTRRSAYHDLWWTCAAGHLQTYDLNKRETA